MTPRSIVRSQNPRNATEPYVLPEVEQELQIKGDVKILSQM